MNVDAIISSLQAHEQKLLMRKEDDVSQTLQSKLSLREDQENSNYELNRRGRRQGRGRDRGRSGQSGRNFQNHERSTFSNSAKARGQRNSKCYMKCLSCNEYGQCAHECWSNPHKC